jgi:hypothetical protein
VGHLVNQVDNGLKPHAKVNACLHVNHVGEFAASNFNHILPPKNIFNIMNPIPMTPK